MPNFLAMTKSDLPTAANAGTLAAARDLANNNPNIFIATVQATAISYAWKGLSKIIDTVVALMAMINGTVSTIKVTTNQVS
jgi:hypothetical protein